MTLHEATKAAQTVAAHADEDAEIIFGAIIDDNLGEEMRVTVIAAGFDRKRGSRQGPGMGTRDRADVEIPSFVQG
jgi:cell division protein FtsZ